MRARIGVGEGALGAPQRAQVADAPLRCCVERVSYILHLLPHQFCDSLKSGRLQHVRESADDLAIVVVVEGGWAVVLRGPHDHTGHLCGRHL